MCLIQRLMLSGVLLVSGHTVAIADTDLPMVIVTATRGEKNIEDAPGPVSVVSRATLEARGIQNLQDAINTVPGVFVRPGRGISDVQQSISLHGVPDEKRTLVMIDGQPINDAYAGGLNLGGLPAGMLDRVEVNQGPASALYGGNAVGGAVNYITRLPKGPEATLRLGYGDAAHRGEAPSGTRWASLVAGTRLENGLAVMATMGYRGTNGYPSEWVTTTTAPPAGTVGALPTIGNTGTASYIIGHKGDNRWTDQSLGFRLAFPLAKGDRITAGFIRQVYDYDFGTPASYLTNASGSAVYTYVNGATVRTNAFNASYGAYQRDLWKLGYETTLGVGELKLDVGYTTTPKSWYVTASGSDTAFNTTTLSDGPGRITRGEASGWNADLLWTLPLDAHQLTLGTAVKFEQAKNSDVSLTNWKDPGGLGAPTSEARGRSRTLAVFAQDEWRITENTTVWTGARWDHWRTSDGYGWNSLVAAPFNQAETYGARTATALSPKVALVHRLTPAFAVKTSVGQAFRPPTVYELYRTFRIGSLATVYQNNPQLVPEKTTSADLGFEAKLWQGAKLDINAFHNRFTDLIYTAGSGSPRQRVNAGLAQSQGVLLSFEQKISPSTRLFVNATQQTGTVLANTTRPTSVGKDLTWIPRRMTNLGVETKRGPWGLNATVRHATRQYSLDDNTDVTTGVYGSYDGYTVADTRVTYTLTGGTEVGFAIDNLTNHRYFSNYIAPGRSWAIDLKIPF
jgi:iron complex outermembrane receptor protein